MKNKLNILYYSPIIPDLLKDSGKPTGGAAVEWNIWLKAFKKLGHKVGILTWEGAANYIGKEVEYDIVESYNDKKGIPKLRIIYNFIPNYIKAIISYGTDVLAMEASVDRAGLLAIITRLLGKKFVYRIASDMDVDGRLINNFSKIVLITFNFALRLSNHISCQNEYQYSMLKKKYPKKSISILYNPFIIREINLPEKRENYIAWIGNFRYEKNLPALAKIAAKLPGIKFKIAGSKFTTVDDDTKIGLAELEKLQNVDFVGYISNDDIPSFLSNAKILLNTSRLEGFSNTFLEAWSVGTPIVTTKNVNPDNIIGKFNLGKVAEDYDKIPEIIKEIFNYSEKEMKEISLRCINYIKEHHDYIALSKKFINEIKAV